MESIHYKNLQELHEAIFNCRKCLEIPVDVTNIQPPWDFSRGKLTLHKWGMMIGQAPGKTETDQYFKMKNSDNPVKKNIPKTGTKGKIAFSGDAGQRFISWLVDAGLSPEECKNLYKTAVVKCYPDKWPTDRKSDRKPGVKEVRLCRHFLEEQIRLIKPKVLIPMGKVAIQWFFPGAELKDTIGIEKFWHGIPTVCFPHSSNASNWWKNHEEKVQAAKNILTNLHIKM